MGESNSILRRDFLKGAAVGAAGLAAFSLAGCSGGSVSQAQAETQSMISWDREADVVIVGGGGAGLAAAYEAASAGADTLVLEKASMVGGTTALSAAVTQAAGTIYQKEMTDYKDDTVEKHFAYFKAASEDLENEELLKDLIYGCPEVIRWYVEDLGLEIEGVSAQSHIPSIDPSLYAARIHRPKGEGGNLITVLSKAAASNGAKVETDTEVTKLITDSNGAVIGVEATAKKETFMVKANKGVILATCSMDHNEEMARTMCPQHYWVLNLVGCMTAPTNTGDGIRMGQAIGANIVNLSGGGATIRDLKLGTGRPIWTMLFVNKAGRRYTCEDAHYAYMIRMQYTAEKSFNHPCYAVWGESNLENCKPWDASTIKDAIAAGTVIAAPTLEELAEAIGVDAAGLNDTVRYWNEVTAPSGADTEFGRKSGFEQIEGSMFYANRITFDNMGSSGGVAIDVDTHVLRPDGSIIPGLYAAGMVAGGYIGAYYVGSGTGMASNFHFGRKAGRNAAGA